MQTKHFTKPRQTDEIVSSYTKHNNGPLDVSPIRQVSTIAKQNIDQLADYFLSLAQLNLAVGDILRPNYQNFAN